MPNGYEAMTEEKSSFHLMADSEVKKRGCNAQKTSHSKRALYGAKLLLNCAYCKVTILGGSKNASTNHVANTSQ